MDRLLAVLALMAVLASHAGAAEPGVHQIRLKNGLTVLLRPVEGAGLTALVTLYALGEDHDPQGASGLAHLVEHAYVTAATDTMPARTVEQFIERYPHGWLAQTEARHSAFGTVFQPGDLPAELQEAAERMNSLRITAADLDRERPRILDELRSMYLGLPEVAASNLAREMIRPAPHGGRKGGVPEQMNRLGPERVREHWQRYYKPRNATLVLAGGFDPGDARRRIAELFGPLPSGEEPPAPAPLGKQHLGAIDRLTIKPFDPKAPPQVCVAYAAPRPEHELYAAFLVLAARLQAESAKVQVHAEHVPARFAPLDEPDCLCVGMPVVSGRSGDESLARLDRFVTDTVNVPLRKSDLAVAQRTFAFYLATHPVPEAVLARDALTVAYTLGRRSQLGIDPIALAKAIEGVSDHQLRQAAEHFFSPRRSAAVSVGVRR